jgi:hypothetical protein
MPAQQCVRADEKRRSARSTEQSAGRSQEDTVTLVQPRPGDLAAKNREFVSQHDNFELLELARAQPQRRHRKRTPKQEVHNDTIKDSLPGARVRSGRLYGPTGSEASSSYRMDLRTRQAWLGRADRCGEAHTIRGA